MVKPHSSNFRVITTNVLGVGKLRIITVFPCVFVFKDLLLIALHEPADEKTIFSTSLSSQSLHCLHTQCMEQVEASSKYLPLPPY